jgi:hypothetical protein
MALTPLVRLVTRTGGESELEVEPLPSWPYPLTPQHMTLPSVRRAQACPLPAAIAVALPVAEGSTEAGALDASDAAGASEGAAVLPPVDGAADGPVFDGTAVDPHAATTRIAAASTPMTREFRPTIPIPSIPNFG